MNRVEERKVSLEHVSNIVACVLDATEEEHAAGMLWYETFGRAITSYGKAHQWSPERARALFAALSPMMNIARNWKLFKAGIDHSTLDGMGGILPHQRRKGEALCKGTISIEAAIKGMKVSRFYRNLAGDMSCVTVDRHAISCARGIPCYTGRCSCAEYKDIEASYQVAAAQLGIEPAQCQAIAWVVWRRQQGIKDGGGMELVA